MDGWWRERKATTEDHNTRFIKRQRKKNKLKNPKTKQQQYVATIYYDWMWTELTALWRVGGNHKSTNVAGVKQNKSVALGAPVVILRPLTNEQKHFSVDKSRSCTHFNINAGSGNWLNYPGTSQLVWMKHSHWLEWESINSILKNLQKKSQDVSVMFP